jgi:hypothetical protein
VSERQLGRWHQDGLMPRPGQTWIAGSPGSTSIYPIGSGDQLIMLCAVGKRFRRSEDIGWSLWWLGFPIDVKFWLGRLRRLAALYDTKLSTNFRLAMRGDRIADLKAHRTSNVIFRRLRKRIGPNEFNSVMTYLSDIISGDFEGWGPSFDSRDEDILRDKKAIGKALGIKVPRRKEDLMFNLRYPPEVEPALLLLSNRLGGARLIAVLNNCAEEHIFLARNKIRCILTSAQFFPKTIENGIIDKATPDMIDVLSQYAFFLKPTDQALFLLLFLTLMEDKGFNSRVDDACDLFIAATRKNGISKEMIDRLRRTDRVLADGLGNVRSQTEPSD